MADSVIEPTPTDADERTCIEVFNEKGELVERSYGQSWDEQQTAHDRGECDAFCGICYHEAMMSIGLE